jgi:hypothetical protein
MRRIAGTSRAVSAHALTMAPQVIIAPVRGRLASDQAEHIIEDQQGSALRETQQRLNPGEVAARGRVDGAVAALAHIQSSSVTSLDHPLLRERGIRDLSRGAGPAVRGCLDWTEQVPHLAGRLGTALLTALLAHPWVTRCPRDRAVDISQPGDKHFQMPGIHTGISALASCFTGRSRSPGPAPAVTRGYSAPQVRLLSRSDRTISSRRVNPSEGYFVVVVALIHDCDRKRNLRRCGTRAARGSTKGPRR